MLYQINIRFIDSFPALLPLTTVQTVDDRARTPSWVLINNDLKYKHLHNLICIFHSLIKIYFSVTSTSPPRLIISGREKRSEVKRSSRKLRMNQAIENFFWVKRKWMEVVNSNRIISDLRLTVIYSSPTSRLLGFSKWLFSKHGNFSCLVSRCLFYSNLIKNPLFMNKPSTEKNVQHGVSLIVLSVVRQAKRAGKTKLWKELMSRVWNVKQTSVNGIVQYLRC